MNRTPKRRVPKIDSREWLGYGWVIVGLWNLFWFFMLAIILVNGIFYFVIPREKI